ncbi:hypothetical protein PR202_gb07356 [Eleusine coracana subsp. coracana]|uniref:Reverse transcriptase n=1 Tax=Eleusine coracana subsp. coracana TaxID=191504 RepID=A0AAV5ECD7_ELECO|nr:hypothetical protein PR202_gb07356 [Eleusine coracana subsp. coracana]
MNTNKSAIHFSNGCSNSIRDEIKGVLNMHNEALNEKYLGMPTDIGNSVNGAFQYLKDRVWQRIQGWLEQCLSAGGKEILIKAVAQAIPTYSMACFRLPAGLCHHIDGLLCSFWWGSKAGKRQTCWVTWDDMTKPEYMGGLGFRDMELLHLALFAHQAWRILREPESLSARVLKAVYFPNTDFLDADVGARPSRVWRAIIEGREVMKQGIIKRIGSGESTNIWKTNWIPRDGLMKPVCWTSESPPQLVSELIDQTSRT